MKIIEGLKQIKDLQRKAEDLRKLVNTYCAASNVDTPTYPDQKKKIREWIQSHEDIVKEILRLRLAIQQTNVITKVTIQIDDKTVTKTIAEWIHRRRDLAGLDLKMWQSLGDRGVREGYTQSPSGEKMEIKIVRYFDPEERDKKVDLYSSEPVVIDSRLEIVNAVTDLVEG